MADADSTPDAPSAPDTEYLSKVKYVEEQVVKNLDFQFESMALLTAEAHSTLKWLFSLVIAPAGYALNEIKNDQWSLVIPLAISSGLAAHEIWKLIDGALLAQDIPSVGNEPDNLATDEMLAQSEAQLRLGHTLTLQNRIDRMTGINDKKAKAINRARMAIVIIPLVGLSLTVLTLFIWYLAPDLPCVFRL